MTQLVGGRWRDFVQGVRRYRRTPLLELVARLAIDLDAGDDLALPGPAGGPTSVTPFSLAAVAKVALAHGNEHRDLVAGPVDLRRLCDVYMDVGEAYRFGEEGSLERFFIQTAHEQFPWQQTPHHDIGRTHALYVGAASRHPVGEVVVGFETDVLGASLAEYVSALLVWHVGATRHGGFVQREWLDQPNFVEIVQAVGRGPLELVLDRLTAPIDAFRELAVSHQLDDATLRRFEFNPLIAKPIVELPDGRLLAPQSALIRHRMGAGSIYYDLIASLGTPWARDLGEVFEHYIGDNLRLIADCDIYEQVEYDDDQRSVDYFVRTPEHLVLVEVKSKRLVAESRAGGAVLADDLKQGLGEAFSQIRRTADLIRIGHPDFARLPCDLPLAGLVVSLEPYFVAHLEGIRALTGQDPTVPTIVASSAEIEHLAAISTRSDAGAVVDAALTSERDPGVMPRFGEEFWRAEHGRNPLLDEAWRRYRFGIDDDVPE